jgi:hypothetical protein
MEPSTEDFDVQFKNGEMKLVDTMGITLIVERKICLFHTLVVKNLRRIISWSKSIQLMR